MTSPVPMVVKQHVTCLVWLWLCLFLSMQVASPVRAQDSPGCYDLRGDIQGTPHVCICNFFICNELTCRNKGGKWTDACSTCTCDDYPNSGGDGEALELLCFSSRAQVLVEGTGTVPMSEIKSGDRVLTGAGQYETIYAIDHRHPHKEATFVQIHSSSAPLPSSLGGISRTSEEEEQPLEVTHKHMVFLWGQPYPIPAGTVQVGDHLKTVHGPQVVTKISIIARSGIFNPLTASGTIVANGIVASTYSAISSDTEWIEVAPGYAPVKRMAHQDFFHSLLTPYRYFCVTVGLDVCHTKKERVAISEYAAAAYHLMQQQHEVVTLAVGSLVFAVVLALDFTLLHMHLFLLIAALIISCWRHVRMSKKIRNKYWKGKKYSQHSKLDNHKLMVPLESVVNGGQK